MSLSLEVKKFVNSEHTGSYVTIMLPVESQAAAQERSERQARRHESAVNMEGAADGMGYAGGVYGAQQGAYDGQTGAYHGGYDGYDGQSGYEAQGGGGHGQRRMRYESVRIHYTEEGNGEPLILVHTVGQSSYTWRKVFYRLKEYYRVIVLDLPGHGYSDRPVHFDFTVPEYAMALRLFMDAMGIESAHLAGFSLGAVYALQFACDYPARIGRLILLTPGGVTDDMPTAVKMIDSAVFGGIASRLYGMRTVRRLLEECVFDLTNINDEVVAEYYKPASDADGRRSIRASLHNFDEQPLFPRLREVGCPVLILQGSEDRWHKASDVEIFHTAIRSAGFLTVRNVGHLLHEEKPERFVAAVLEFIPVVMPEL